MPPTVRRSGGSVRSGDLNSSVRYDAPTPELPGEVADVDVGLAAPEMPTVLMNVKTSKTPWWEEIIAWAKALTSAALYATVIVTFVFQVARVEGWSMAPTLADQDRLVVNKFIYLLHAPQRGDVVMLYYPEDPDKSFVKRVIAEPGDVVHIVDGKVFVNDVQLHDDFVLPEFRSHEDFGPTTVPRAYYFVMGDHRNNSSDSRTWGPVPKRYIVGKVQLRWWPIPQAHLF